MKCVWGDIGFQEQREKDMAALNKANNEIQSLQEAVRAAQALASEAIVGPQLHSCALILTASPDNSSKCEAERKRQEKDQQDQQGPQSFLYQLGRMTVPACVGGAAAVASCAGAVVAAEMCSGACSWRDR